MLKKICILVLTSVALVSVTESAAQIFGPEAKINEAIRLMDEGQYSESEALLRKVISRDAKNFRAWYELAYLQYSKKEYAEAVETAKIAAALPDASDLVYQIAGNAADMAGDPQQASDLYAAGLEKFPNSGRLFLEMGNLWFNAEAYAEALHCYEQAIAVDPSYPSAYRSAATILLSSAEPLWGMLYGEIFINLERTTKRNRAMGDLLFEAYKMAVEIGEQDGKRKVEYHFSGDDSIYAGDKEVFIPFPLTFSLLVEEAFPVDAKEVDLESLHRMRSKFVDLFFTEGEDNPHYSSRYPNILFNYHRRLVQAGHFEAYNYWVFGVGDQAAAGNAWRDSHPKQMDAFIKWFIANPMTVDQDHHFHRSQYDQDTDEL